MSEDFRAVGSGAPRSHLRAKALWITLVVIAAVVSSWILRSPTSELPGPSDAELETAALAPPPSVRAKRSATLDELPDLSSDSAVEADSAAEPPTSYDQNLARALGISLEDLARMRVDPTPDELAAGVALDLRTVFCNPDRVREGALQRTSLDRYRREFPDLPEGRYREARAIMATYDELFVSAAQALAEARVQRFVTAIRMGKYEFMPVEWNANGAVGKPAPNHWHKTKGMIMGTGLGTVLILADRHLTAEQEIAAARWTALNREMETALEVTRRE